MFGRIIRYKTITVAGMYVANVLIATPRIPCGQNSFECITKLFVEDWIDNGIKCGIGVTQPWEYLKGLTTYAGFAEGRHNIHTKERHPADKEHTHYNTHRNGGLVVRHMIRWAVIQIADFEFFLLWWFSSSYTFVTLLFGHLAGSGNSFDGFHVLLGITVEAGKE